VFQSIAGGGAVSLTAPFEVRPTVLELPRGATGIIEVMFSPPSVRQYTQEMTMVCDNCQVRHFMIFYDFLVEKLKNCPQLIVVHWQFLIQCTDVCQYIDTE
jgi:hypothetical protein